jgi:hypothetical protein
LNLELLNGGPMLFGVAAVSDVPDVTGEQVAIRARNRLSLRARVSMTARTFEHFDPKILEMWKFPVRIRL